jgi:hypothetical protein
VDKDVARVLNGYANLTLAQRSDFIDVIKQYNRGNEYTRDSLVKEAYRNVQKMDLGPTGGGCPCCGK